MGERTHNLLQCADNIALDGQDPNPGLPLQAPTLRSIFGPRSRQDPDSTAETFHSDTEQCTLVQPTNTEIDPPRSFQDLEHMKAI
jgi:hypothetical protein